jgi:serine/threonine-protein kinase
MANLAYGQALYFARRFDDAMLQFRACVELEPNDPWAHTYLAKLHERKGQFDLAALEHQKDMRYSGRELEEIAAYSQAYTAGGWEVALKWTIDNLEAKAGREHGPAPSLSLAAAYAKLGEQDKAFEWLEKAYERRNSSLPYLAVNPDFDPLRDDPRFDDLLRRIGLEPSGFNEPDTWGG